MPRTHQTLAAVALAGALATSITNTALGASPGHHAKEPVKVSVFSPGPGDRAGSKGVGFIVDVALDATNARGNRLLSAGAGYKPFFHDPMAPDFHPGPDPGAPGLVVLLSTTPTMPGTPFKGPRTNLAGLFQINGVAKVAGKAETWNTWQPGKALFGLDRRVKLTVYTVAGTAPAVVPVHGSKVISNTVTVPFTISG